MGPLPARLPQGHDKGQERERVRRQVVGVASIPGNWASFLRVDDNKTGLFSLLSAALIYSFELADKQVVITDGEAIPSKPELLDTTSLAPCTQEEADSRMMLHAAHATHHGHSKITIHTVDTDVVILAVQVCTLEVKMKCGCPLAWAKLSLS